MRPIPLRLALIPILACLLPRSSFADTASWCREQRRIAADQEPVRAGETLRFALIGARRAGLHAEAARCLLDMARWRLGWEIDAPPETEMESLVGPLAREALAEARISGDRWLEYQCAEEASHGFDPESEEGAAAFRAVLDAAIASNPWGWLSSELMFEHDIDAALKILDLRAEAALALKRGDAAAAAKLYAQASGAAQDAKLPLSAALAELDSVRATLATGKVPGPVPGMDFMSARNTFATRGDFRGLAEADFLMGSWIRTMGAGKEARIAFDQALLSARELGDVALEAEILLAIASVAPDAEKDQWKRDAAQAEERRHNRILERADSALAQPSREMEGAVVEDLRAERLGRPDDAAEIDRRLDALGAGTPVRRELPAASREKLKALLKSDRQFETAVTLEALRRTEAFPVLVELVSAAEHPPVILSAAMETLALPADLPTLLKLVSSKNADVAECAAGAIFRLATAADLPAIRKALETASPSAAVWLRAILAREGDAAALAALREAAKSATPEVALNALTALARLGFATPFKALSTLPPDYAEGWKTQLVLGRAPEAWGATLSWIGVTQPLDRAYSARAANVRNDRTRLDRMDEESEATALVYEFPRTPAERFECGTAWFTRTGKYIAEGGDEVLWAAEASGLSLDNTEKTLKDRKDNPLAQFAAEDLEWHRYGAVAGTQIRVLTIRSGSAWARVRCIASPSTGEVIDNSLKLPFWTALSITEGGGGGLIPALERINLKISLTDLFTTATVNIPGFGPIESAIHATGDHNMTVTAKLPVVAEGPGLGEAKLIPMETLEKGTVTLRLKVAGAETTMTFPLSFLVPPKKDKPDLVAAEMILEPSVPKVGDDVVLTLRARNIGKVIEKGGVLNTRFSVLNPQTGEGKRTIDVRLFESAGWRPGEWRTFEARPKVVKGWYMNKYATSWTLEMGDTRLSAKIDADEKLVEDKEDNNICELQVPLYLPDAEGRKIATADAVAKLEPLIAKVGEAKTSEDAYTVIGLMRGVLQKIRVDSPEIDVIKRHIEAAVVIQCERIRVREAIAQVEELAKSPKVNKQKLQVILGNLVAAETSLMKAGVPITEDTLSWYRNRVQATGSALGATTDALELAGHVTGNESDALSPLKKVGDAIGVIDGALQWARYARDRREGRDMDSSDAIEGTASLINSTSSLLGAAPIPGLSKFHQAALGAEIDYIDKGFRKEANALNALADLIEGKEGAQDRLNAAVRDVDQHVSAGPFTKEASKNILLGFVKDVPVLGKIVDGITSWK